MSQIHITAKGIRAALKKYTPMQSLVEYVWNGFDAQASRVDITFDGDELGGVVQIRISDNGYGIAQEKLQEKFEPMFESRKALENVLKKNRSAIHGKNGIGRLTFFTFARHAQWKTVFEENGNRYVYEIFANAESINLYSGVNASKSKTDAPTGTEVSFTGIHGLTTAQLQQEFRLFLIKEFAWFLQLNSGRGFMITLNGQTLDCSSYVAEQETFELFYAESSTEFFVRYVQWQGRMNTELPKYYYLNAQGEEMWKEPTAVKSKGERFYHSLYIQSSYFDTFNFRTHEAEQQALIGGVRSDKQFKFMRRKVANFLRIKRKPFLKSHAAHMIGDFEKANIFNSNLLQENRELEVILKELLKVLYQMQPKIFSGLNGEQKKMLIGLLSVVLASDRKKQVPEIIATFVDLSDEERADLQAMIS